MFVSRPHLSKYVPHNTANGKTRGTIFLTIMALLATLHISQKISYLGLIVPLLNFSSRRSNAAFLASFNLA